MAESNPLLVNNGINAGSPFGLNHLVKVTFIGPPPQLSAIAPTSIVDTLSAIEYLNIPNSAGTSVPTNQNATETIRIKGGLIVEGSGTDSIQIGRGASAAATDSIIIGRGSSTTNANGTVVIGAATSVAGNLGVFIGFGLTITLASGVVIGANATITGNAGGAGGVVLGNGATLATGNVGGGTGVVIGPAASAGHPSSVAIGASATLSFSSNVGQNSVAIGQGATSNKAGVTIVGGSASVNQTGGIAIGAGAVSSLNSSTATQASIVIGQTASTTKDGCIVIGSTSALTSTASACIGHGCLDMGANVIQLGGPGASYDVLVLGAGDTKASPAAKGIRFTNATGADNAAGDFTLLAPLSTGSATPARLTFLVGAAGGSSSTLQTTFTALQLDASTTAGDIRMLVYDVTAAASVRVSRGAADSGGVGFRVLRVPN